jgi:hypothetical protein
MKSISIFCGLFLITIIISILSSSLCLYQKKYVEDPENMKRRLNYLQSKSEEITGGLLEFVHTEEAGIYCKTKRDIEAYEEVFKLPKKYMITICKKIIL